MRLLIVDDEAVTRKGLLKHIHWTTLGILQVEEAEDGPSGLVTAQTFLPDIVLSDIRMPGMDGIEFANEIKRVLPDCKLIFISGYSDKAYMKAAIQLRAIHYVEKPINISEVENAIQRAVEQCQREQEKHLVFNQTLPYLRRSIVLKLLSGEIGIIDLDEQLKLVSPGFTLNPPICVLHMRTFPQEHSETIFSIVENGLAKCNFIGTAQENDYLAILSNVSDIETDLRLCFSKVRARIQERIPCADLFCAVGKRVFSTSELIQSSKSADQRMQKLFYRGFGHIAFSENERVHPTGSERDYTDEFIECLRNRQSDAAKAYVDSLSFELKQNEFLPVHKVKGIFFTLASALFQEIDRIGITLKPESIMTEEYLWPAIYQMQTLDETTHFIKKLIFQMHEGIEQLTSGGRAIYNAKAFIQDHYAQIDLSVNQIAAHVFLTPTYLSSLFKRETGETISEYITSVRIEKSTNMLKDPRIKLFEVAQSVGYKEANYYAKVFKRKMNLTPKEYREKYGL